MWSGCVEVFQRSTVHGLAHASAAQTRAGRSFWLFLILLGFGAFVFNMAQIVTRYYETPILTSYFNDYENMTWPDITFCNNVPVNLVNKTIYGHWESLLKRAELLNWYLANVSQLHYFEKFSESDLLNQVTKPTLALSSLDPHLFDFGNPQLFIYDTGFLQYFVTIQRSIEDGGAWDYFPANVTPYRPVVFFNRHRMPCFTFQLPHSFSEERRQRITSLFFFLVYDYESYERFSSAFTSYGGRLYITKPNHVPSIDARIQSQPGFQRVITIKQVRGQFNKEKRDCRDEHFYEELYDPFLLNTHRYEVSAEDCKTLLSQKLIYWNCGCFSPFLPVVKIDDRPPHLCFNMSHFSFAAIANNSKCLFQLYQKFEQESEFEQLVTTNCAKHRQRLCSKLTYRIDTNAEMLAEQWSMDVSKPRIEFQRSIVNYIMQKKYPTLLDPTANMSNLDIIRILRREVNIVLLKTHSLFGDLVIEEEEYPLSQLFSDIGGLMGLYLGISVVGMFEIFEIIYILIRNLNEHRRHYRESSRILSQESQQRTSVVYQPVTHDSNSIILSSPAKSCAIYVNSLRNTDESTIPTELKAEMNVGSHTDLSCKVLLTNTNDVAMNGKNFITRDSQFFHKHKYHS